MTPRDLGNLIRWFPVLLLFWAFAGASVAFADPEFAHIATLTDNSNGTEYTFSSASLGTADADRYIIVAINWTATGGSISSVTIAGVTATVVVEAENSARWAALAIAAVPTGTTGDIVVSLNGTGGRCSVNTYRAVDIDSPTPYDTGSSTASAPTADIDISDADGFAIACATQTDNGLTCTWSGLTEDSDAALEGMTYTSASDELTEETGRTMTATYSGTPDLPVAVFASWSYPGASSTIEISSPTQYHAFQRDGSDEADIDVSGTYNGTPTTIEYRIDSGSWATLDASPSGGSFSGTAAGVAAGWRSLSVRHSNETDVTDTVSDLRIGDVFIVGGQSNMAGAFDNPQTYSGSGASIYDTDDAWASLTTGYTDPDRTEYSLLPRLAATIEADTGYPVGFIYHARGGTSLVSEDADWEATDGSDYIILLAAITGADTNGAAAMLWDQGERDIVVGSISASVYQAALEAMHDALQTAAGYTFPLIAAQTGETPDAPTAADVNSIRDGQLDAVDGNADIYFGPISYDRAGLHWQSDAEATVNHDRWWAAIDAAVFDGTNTTPRLSSGSWDDDDITLTFDQTLSTEASLTTSAWAVTDDNGTRTVSAASASGTAVTLTVDQTLADPVTVRLASGDTGSEATVPTNAGDLPAAAFTSGVDEFSGVYSHYAILGGYPVAGSAEYEEDVLQVASVWLGQCPIERGTTYYFDADNGNDSTGDGSEDAPWQSIAKMNTEAGSDVALKLKRGCVWREASTAIDVAGGSLSAYGTGAKPVISGFTQTIAAGGSAWTRPDEEEARWTTTSIATLGWLREQGTDWGTVYTEVTSTEDVEDTPRSFYATGGTLHINPGSVEIDPNDIAWEATPASGTAFHGVTSGEHGTRVHNIVTVGQNCRSSLTASYGIGFTNSGDEVCVASSCESYYHSRHNFGQIIGSPGATGGRTLFYRCAHGWINETNGLDIVCFSYDGLQEGIVLECYGPYGVLPSGTTRDYCNGTATICHTDASGANPVGAFHVIGHHIPNDHTFGFAAVFRGNDGNPASTLADVRNVCHRAYMPANYGTAQAVCLSNSAITSSQIYNQVGADRVSAQAITSNTESHGFLISSYVVLDMSQVTVDRMSFINDGHGDVLPTIANSHIHFVGDGDDGQMLFFRAMYFGDVEDHDALDPYDIDVSNNIFTAENMGTGEATPGLYNPPSAVKHTTNAFFGLDAAETETRGASNWDGNVTLTANPANPFLRDFKAIELIESGNQSANILPECDLLGRRLAVPGEAIGPYGRISPLNERDSDTLRNTLRESEHTLNTPN